MNKKHLLTTATALMFGFFLSFAIAEESTLKTTLEILPNKNYRAFIGHANDNIQFGGFLTKYNLWLKDYFVFAIYLSFQHHSFRFTKSDNTG